MKRRIKKEQVEDYLIFNTKDEHGNLIQRRITNPESLFNLKDNLIQPRTLIRNS